MISANSLIKLMKENLKQRAWLASLQVIVLFFGLPVYGVLTMGSYVVEEGESVETAITAMASMRELLLNLLGGNSGPLSFLVIGLAVLAGLNSFSYLFSKKKVDFYHSLPVRREVLFAVSSINSVLMFVIPYFLFSISEFVLCIKAYSLDGCSALWPNVFFNLFSYTVMYLLFYAITVLASMLTGHLLIAILAAVALLVYNPCANALLQAMRSLFFTNHSYMQEDGFSIFNPIVWYVANITSLSNGNIQWTIPFLKMFLWAVALLIISLIIYRIRKSEVAGNALAFVKLKPVIRILIIIPAALACGLFFRELAAKLKDAWFIFGLLSGCLLTHGILQVILEFDFKAIFRGRRILALCASATFLIACVFWFDLIGYDTWVPKTEQIKSGGIYIEQLMYGGSYEKIQFDEGVEESEINSNVSYILNTMQISDKEGLKALTELAKEGTKETKKKTQGINTTVSSTKDGEMLTFTIRYILSGNRIVYRNYSIVNTKENLQKIAAICNSEEYKEAVYPILSGKGIEDKNVYLHKSDSHVDKLDLTKEEYNKFCKAYSTDLKEMDFSTRINETPISNLIFVDQNTDYYAVVDSYYPNLAYQIYPSFKNTLALLNKLGIKPRLDEEEIKKISITYSIYNEEDTIDEEDDMVYEAEEIASYNEDEQFTHDYTDKAQIKELLNYLILYPASDSIDSLLFDNESFYDVTGYTNLEEIDGEDMGISVNYIFTQKKGIPDFVKKDLGITE